MGQVSRKGQIQAARIMISVCTLDTNQHFYALIVHHTRKKIIKKMKRQEKGKEWKTRRISTIYYDLYVMLTLLCLRLHKIGGKGVKGSLEVSMIPISYFHSRGD